MDTVQYIKLKNITQAHMFVQRSVFLANKGIKWHSKNIPIQSQITLSEYKYYEIIESDARKKCFG